MNEKDIKAMKQELRDCLKEVDLKKDIASMSAYKAFKKALEIVSKYENKSNQIVDIAFGELTYDYGWIKNDTKKIYNVDTPYTLIVAAYPGEEITNKQREAYKSYLEYESIYFNRLPSVLIEYFVQQELDMKYSTPTELINFKQLLITRDGRCVWLCDCVWDIEHGIAILCNDGKVQIVCQEEVI